MLYSRLSKRTPADTLSARSTGRVSGGVMVNSNRVPFVKAVTPSRRSTNLLVVLIAACWIVILSVPAQERFEVEVHHQQEVVESQPAVFTDQDKAKIKLAIATSSLDVRASEDVGVAVEKPSSLASSTPQRQVVAPTPSACLTDEMLSLVGVSPTDYSYARAIVFKESSCNYLAKNPNSSAVGLCQAMASVHVLPDNYLTDPTVQMQWCHDYAIRRYGSWANAWTFWQENRWW